MLTVPLCKKAQEEFCLRGSERPLHESLAPNLIDQRDALTNQFDGVTDVPFSYEEYEEARAKLMKLKKQNPAKLYAEANRLKEIFQLG